MLGELNEIGGCRPLCLGGIQGEMPYKARLRWPDANPTVGECPTIDARTQPPALAFMDDRDRRGRPTSTTSSPEGKQGPFAKPIRGPSVSIPVEPVFPSSAWLLDDRSAYHSNATGLNSLGSRRDAITSSRLLEPHASSLTTVYGRPPPVNGKRVRYAAKRSSKELLLRTHRAVIGLIHEIVSNI